MPITQQLRTNKLRLSKYFLTNDSSFLFNNHYHQLKATCTYHDHSLENTNLVLAKPLHFIKA